MQSKHRVMEYITMTFRLWCSHIAGPVLAVIAIGSAIVSAIYWNDPTILAKVAKWSAWSTGVATVLLIFVAQYDAWKSERTALEAEQVKNSGSRIAADLFLGYLDVRHIAENQKGLQPLDRGCCVTVFVIAVNHNECPALFWPAKTTAEMKIGQQCFSGKWSYIWPGITFKDSRLNPNSQCCDFFASIRPHSPMQRTFPAEGFMSFIFEDFDRNLLVDKTSIQANLKIVMQDTLNKPHENEGNLDLLIDSICLIGEAGIPSA